MYCIVCGALLYSELESYNEYGKLEQYHCHDCDTLYTLNADTVSYMKNATRIMEQMMDDLALNNKMDEF